MCPSVSFRFLKTLFLQAVCLPAVLGQYVLAQSPGAEGQVTGSTVARSVPSLPGQNNVMLNLSKNSDYSRVGLDYSLRWDFSDLASFRPGITTISAAARAIYSWDITKNTRFNYYGFKTNPWRIILADEASASGYAAAAGQTGGGLVRRDAPGHRKRLRLSVSPLVNDFKLNFEDNFRQMLLRGSLKNLSPQWVRAGAEGRKEFIRDVLSLGIWDAPMPGAGYGRSGLEFLGR